MTATRMHRMPFGAELQADGKVRFRLWAPPHREILIELDGEARAMQPVGEGWHELVTDRAYAGMGYRFVLPDGLRVPDPASRYQPEDVHGPSEVVDPGGYLWRDAGWRGRPWEEAVVYELHIGAFTPEGTFRAAIGKLDHLVALGVTTIEIMPIGDFPGRRNWGYDGVLPYAPDSSYGRPDDLKALVEAAHARGLMVLLDVVYNHFGPEGAYIHPIAQQTFTGRHKTPWGAAINFDGPESGPVREFVIHNALYWIEEFQLDGLRLDAVHAILDNSPKHLLGELAERVRAAAPDRHIHLILENEENQAKRLMRGKNGEPRWYTAQWNDDVHHALHVAASGETKGYYADYKGDTEKLGRALAEGFAFQGEVMPYRGRPRGEPSASLPPTAFVAFIQNHDQVGNRAFGDRVTDFASTAAVRAIAAVYLLLPQIPMLFMGEEWGAAQPFPFFCDFGPELADAVRKGRRDEFARFPEFQDPKTREHIPDPMAEETFASAKLGWEDIARAPHAGRLDWYRRALAIRHAEIVPVLGAIRRAGRYEVLGEGAVIVCWQLGGGGDLVLAANLAGTPTPGFPSRAGRELWREGEAGADGTFGPWTVRWSVDEDPHAQRGSGASAELAKRMDNSPPGRASSTSPRSPGPSAVPETPTKQTNMSEPDPAPIPRATYRLQFHKGFGFKEAAALAPYLARVGISHVYASPYFKARPGSTHGYDIVDHGQLNPELGDESAFRHMVTTFRDSGLGQVLDFVPNHIGVGGADNPWWLDVLEWGPASEYAGWFDIDWDPDRRYLHDKLLVPFLGDQYGAVLESGQLALRFEPETGGFAVWAHDTHKLPICPLHYQRVLGDEHPELERFGDAFSGLPEWRPRIAQRAKDLQAELGALACHHSDVRQAVQEAVDRINGEPGRLETWRRLDSLIQDQHWRAAHFRVAADDINYRRFFDINELAGLRMELPELFDQAHHLVFELLREGVLDGLRIDHVDGLLDPKGYLLRLREHAPSPFYLVVEKILARHEALREDWPIEGTTGYEFANLLLGLLVDPSGEEGFTQAYTAFTGEHHAFDEIVRDCKIRIMLNEMVSELNVLARDAARVARQNPRTADFTRNILQRGLKEIVACFPVYRTYVDGAAAPADADRRDIDWAVARARRNEADLDPSVFDFLHRLLITDLVAQPRSGFSQQSVVRFAMRVQQYSGPVMAKGLEDTAFYRYNRFVALNEVGGHPDHFGVTLAAFHRANAQRAERWPHAMLGTSTHDTKRGEDTRARLAVLSEMPEEWARQVQAWSRILRARRGDVEGTAPPDRSDEYLFYQLLLGAWPVELTGVEKPDPEKMRLFCERMEGAMVKSMREAKLHSTWASPNTEYEEAMLGFVREALDISRPNAFHSAFLPFQERVARLGVRNSLVQTALKLTLPGMPDIYQGAELWDLSLVDPDNRRPVDYKTRIELLEQTLVLLERNRRTTILEMFEDWRDGRVKLAVIATLLGHRRDQPTLFAQGGYEPLIAAGPKADHVCAFARSHEEDSLLVVAARFPARLEADPDWTGTEIPWPQEAGRGTRWRDLLSGEIVERRGEAVGAEAVLGLLPIAVLVPDGGVQ